jgi:hypothetical protein
MDNVEIANLVANLGGGAVTLYLLIRVMNRLDMVVDRLFMYLERGEAQRQAILRSQGIDPNESGIYKRKDLGLPD